MRIYLVTYSNDYGDTSYRTYEFESDALSQAVEYASNPEFKLDKVLRVATATNTIVEYELAIDRGKIKLQEIRKDEK